MWCLRCWMFPSIASESRGRSFQFAFDGVLFHLYPRFPDISPGCRLYYQLTVLPLVSRSGGFLRHGVAMPLGLGFPRYSRFDHASPHERAILLTIRARQAAIGVVVEIAEPPGRPDAGRVVEIESRHITKSFFRCCWAPGSDRYQGPAAPLGGIKPPIHPAFSQIRKAGAARASSRSTAQSHQSRPPGRHWRRRRERRTARAPGRRTSR